jgi:predicted N-acyltransferase
MVVVSGFVPHHQIAKKVVETFLNFLVREGERRLRCRHSAMQFDGVRLRKVEGNKLENSNWRIQFTLLTSDAILTLIRASKMQKVTF